MRLLMQLLMPAKTPGSCRRQPWPQTGRQEWAAVGEDAGVLALLLALPLATLAALVD
jgi:hypothetical protein